MKELRAKQRVYLRKSGIWRLRCSPSRCISTLEVAEVCLQNQRVDYGKYDESCDVYSLAITLAEALPAPVRGVDDTVAVQRPYDFLYNATGNTVPRFINEQIKENVCC